MRVWRTCGWHACLAFGLKVKTALMACATCGRTYSEAVA